MTLIPPDAPFPVHCYNCILDTDQGEEDIDCGGPCAPCYAPPPPCSPAHCCNGVQDEDETEIDCGGSCDPCPDKCANCKKDSGEIEIDCGGDCPPCEDVTDEKIITNTSQLRPEVLAYNKITAKDATTVKSGEQVSFITEEEGSIVLLPGFKAELGSNFTTQRWEDLSGHSRACENVCQDVAYLSHHHSVVLWSDYLRIYNLHNAVRIEYRIHEYDQNVFIYENAFNISRNGKFELWDCVTGTENPKGTVWYYISYEVFYCKGGSRGYQHKFYVNYPSSKSLNEGYDETENLDIPQYSSSGSLNIQDEIITPSFSIIPNPNPGTFQLETNFPLTDIVNLKVTNTLGAIVYETQNLTSNTIQLATSASGMFFVVIHLKDGTVLTQKMMVQR
jgi:hypothetical protein